MTSFLDRYKWSPLVNGGTLDQRFPNWTMCVHYRDWTIIAVPTHAAGTPAITTVVYNVFIIDNMNDTITLFAIRLSMDEVIHDLYGIVAMLKAVKR